MERIFSRPKRFAEILDLTFRIIKEQFGQLFLLLLTFYSPVIIIQAFVQIFSGRGFIRDLTPGESFFEQIFNTYDFNEASSTIINPAELSGNLLVGLAELIIVPITTAIIILIVKQLKNNEEYELKTLVKQSFTRFWPLVGSYLLFTIVSVSIIVIPLSIIVGMAMFSLLSGGVIGGLLLILLILAMLVGLLLLITRWSFFLPISFFERAPGFSASFRLTKGRTWMTFWLYVTLIIITAFITSAVEVVSLFLGVSVLYTIILNIISIFTTMVFSVGYAVIYFDLDIRQTGNDLKHLIDDYQKPTEDPLG
ncbi:hypothetical protein ACS127_00155 [Amphibacillus sp. Q70]|uniref:hypothetical protein n=1 Tax=Amphibacillus sp. Q70 TaxID=3453416 RepID=UPI003F826E96